MTDEKTEDDTYFEGMDETVVQTTGDEETKETPEGETKESEPAPPAVKENKSVPIAALQDERRKRQNLEEEVENLRGQIPKSNEAPDMYEDEEGYKTYIRNQIQSEINADREQAQSERLNQSRGVMLEQHQDYTEMEKIFEIMATADLSLIDKMLVSEDPAKFAYDSAKVYRESIMGKVEVETEVPDKPSAVTAPSLATATATASNTVQVEKEADIDDVFADITY